jgi:hypothetical protein
MKISIPDKGFFFYFNRSFAPRARDFESPAPRGLIVGEIEFGSAAGALYSQSVAPLMKIFSPRTKKYYTLEPQNRLSLF